MVILWLMMVNNNLVDSSQKITVIILVGGAMCPSFSKYEFVNGKDHIPYMKWKIKSA